MGENPYDSDRIRRAIVRLRVSMYVALSFSLSLALVATVYALFRAVTG